jgi:hypothetical protein
MHDVGTNRQLGFVNATPLIAVDRDDEETRRHDQSDDRLNAPVYNTEMLIRSALSRRPCPPVLF